MNILEKEIEDLIWQGLLENKALLRKKGLWVWDNTNYHRQVDLGSYGRADIIGIQISPKKGGYRYMQVHIIEIKKDEVNIDTLTQAARYTTAIRRIIESKLRRTICTFGITLIGKTVDANSDFVYLFDLVESIAAYTYSIDYEYGILFERHMGYCQKNERFPDMEFWNWDAVSQLTRNIKVLNNIELPI